MDTKLAELAGRLAGDNPVGWGWTGDKEPDDKRDIDATMVNAEYGYTTVEFTNEEGDKLYMNLDFDELQDIHDAIGVALIAARLTGQLS